MSLVYGIYLLNRQQLTEYSSVLIRYTCYRYIGQFGAMCNCGVSVSEVVKVCCWLISCFHVHVADTHRSAMYDPTAH